MKPYARTISLLTLFMLSALSSMGMTEEREFRVINAANDLADNSAQIVVCTKTGRMIISTIGNLNFYDGTSFTHIDTHQKYQFQLPLYNGNYHLYFDHYHHMWLKNTNTVTCVDLLQEQFIEDVDGTIRSEFGCEDTVLDLFVDDNGEVWLLTDKGLYSPQSKQYFQVMRDRNLQDVNVMNDQLLMFYDNGEEVGIDLKDQKVAHRTKPYEWDEAQNYLKSSVTLRYQDGYYQIRNGEKKSLLMYFDQKKLSWTKIMDADYHLNNLTIENDKLYMASEYGYWVIDIATGEKQHIESLKLFGSNKELITDCNTLSFDKQGGMWIGTEKRGLLYARPTLSPFKVYTWDQPEATKYAAMLEGTEDFVGDFKGIQTNCTFKDSRGWTWFGTTMGLYMYHSPQSEPVVFTKKAGLLNNVIHSIVEDKQHNIWVSTSCGISCILFEGKRVVFVNSFSQSDNVPNESFVNCKAMCLDDGMIIMQSIDHVVAFHPDDFGIVNGRKLMRLYPKLVKLLVNGNYVEPGEAKDGNVIIDRAITRMKDIRLNADQNSISLTFSGLNYFRPLQTYYRVKVKGVDDEWKVLSYFNSNGMVDHGGMLHLPLLGLKPGTYEVAVDASLFPDIWPDDDPYVWNIYVNQPWWQATGVYLLLGLLVLGMLIVNFYFFNKNTRMRTRLNSEEGDLIRKIRSFSDRCDAHLTNTFGPTNDDAYSGDNNQFAPEFVTLMTSLLPYIRQHKSGQLTMRRLSEVGNIDVAQLYETLSGQLYKNPRNLARHILLQKAADLLRTTEKSVEEVADECGFSTPNYFMGNFFHQYKMTPREYREENA